VAHLTLGKFTATLVSGLEKGRLAPFNNSQIDRKEKQGFYASGLESFNPYIHVYRSN